MTGRLDGKVALVTGSTMGIGAAIAQRFAAEGAAVAVLGRSVNRGSAVTDDINEEGGRAMFLNADLTSDQSVDEAVRSAVEEFGGLHVLVNNAAATDAMAEGADGSSTVISDEQLDRLLQVGLHGTLRCCRHCVPHMLEAGTGSVINISSVAGIRGVPGAFGYSASKGALNAITRQVAEDHGAAGIRSNSITCGFIVSNEVAQMMMDHPVAGPAFDSTLLVPRRGRPEDVAAAAVYLASDESGFVTGAELVVDGGTSCRSGYPDPLEIFASEVAE